MSGVKGEQTPTDIISAPVTAYATDKRGRVITVKRLTALDYYRVTKVLGDSNAATFGMASLACTVRRIDTTDFALPTTERDVEFILQQLDFDGLTAAGEALEKLNPADEADKAAAKN